MYHSRLMSEKHNILMDRYNNVGLGANPATTENVLKLSGSLSEQTISLGNLGITKDKSIELATGTTAELTAVYGKTKDTMTASTINVRNILVPSDSSLYLLGKTDEVEHKGSLILKPAASYAGIGGEGAKSYFIDAINFLTSNILQLAFCLCFENSSTITSLYKNPSHPSEYSEPPWPALLSSL